MNKPTFADLLAELLLVHDRSMSWLARQIGVHPSTVSRWIDGICYPASLHGVDDILKAFNITDAKAEKALMRAYRNVPRYRRA
jgi:transposase-like protein